MPFRGVVAGAALTAAALVAVPVVATAAPAPATTATEVVGGPDLAAKGVVVRPGPGSTPLPAVNADTWLVADLTTGEVLAAKGAHTRVLPASTLKTLTAVTLMPRLDKNQVVTATWEEARADGGHVGIVPGATYTLWDLWHGLLLPSANDAAAAIADANGGMAKTVAEMQDMAHRLRADDTTVVNNSGLDAKGQLSSAYDMALFARAALAIPDFRLVTMTTHYAFPGKPAAPGATRSTYQIYTQDRLLLHGYRGTIGGKTGFTSLAHRTFWGAASRDGHTIVATLFQIHEPTETAVRALLDWGFANTGKVTPVGTLVAPLPDPAPAAQDGAAAGSGSTSASAATPAAGRRIPWVPVAVVALLLAIVGVAVLLLRRRGRRPALPGTRRLTVKDMDDPAGPVPSAPRPVRPAAVRTPSVVVSARPGTAPTTDAGSDDVPPPGPGITVVAAPGTATAPASVPAPDPAPPTDVRRPEEIRPHPVPSPVDPAVAERGPAHASPEPEPELGADAPSAAPPAPRPAVGGHVKVIAPPTRPPRS